MAINMGAFYSLHWSHWSSLLSLTQGTRLDSCEIIELLGSGGMGEVYRGRDTKLGRDVAVKALPDVFARDALRIARFEREAQALAALNHPNIAAIHELKELAGARYLILELVEGETLAELIARGPVPIDDAVKIARQIAEALEAAHDKGVVHRDLKPANVKITPEGRVKVLDFGLARIAEPPNAGRNVSQAQTLSGLNTAAGMILGTAAYMSPEQARGKEVDKRADVWAFGCVVFELLVGRQTFPQGETVADTLAGILARDPEWQTLPADVPPRIRTLLERCLRKDPTRRLQDMGNARIELEEAHSESEAITLVARPIRRQRENWMVWAALASFLILAGVASWFLLRSASQQPTLRFEAVVPLNLAPDSGLNLSPDGLKIAYVTSQPPQIWVRTLESAAAVPIPSTDGIASSSIFWSPDSQHLGFFAEGKLKRVAAAGGPAQVLATLPPGGNYSGTWSTEEVILVGSDASPGGPLLRVPAGSGEAKPATELDKTKKETSHRFPRFLPDGRHYVYLVTGADARDRASYVGDLNSKDRRPLPGIAAEANYSSSGHLIFIRDGALMAQPFNLKRLELTGPAFPVADPFAPAAALSYPFSVSMTGALTFRTNATGGSLGAGGGGGPTLLTWFDKRGLRLDPAGSEGEYRNPELSPDGKFVAFTRGAPGDIYVLDIANAREDKITSDAADDSNPRWSPDGARIAFDSVRDGNTNLFERAFRVVGEDKLLLKSDSAKTLGDWTRDGKYLVYTADNDIWALPLSAKSDSKGPEVKPIQITKTAFNEITPRVSPDGHWIAYASNEQGEFRVYVQSFPEPGIKQPVSDRGAIEPRWSRDSKELYYYSGTQYPFNGNGGFVAAVSIQAAGNSLVVGAPATRAQRQASGTTFYSVAPDGRFLVQINAFASGRGGTLPGLGGRPVGTNREFPVITVLLNWAASKGASLAQ
jgi:eukaryotic-like serine/threonine-protein kinase